MDFVFMLTRDDRTIPNAVETLRTLRGTGLRHVGWKDVGSTVEVMRALHDEARHQGATTYLEMVALELDAEMQGATTAGELGVDVLLGGVHVQQISRVLRGSSVRYYPFVGIPEGHPTDLRGDPARIEADCRTCLALGCEGVDLLAYRAVEANPLDLVRAARAGLGTTGRLVCAGSVNNASQLKNLASAGCDAFTIGTAVFDNTFAPDRRTVVEQVTAVLDSSASTHREQQTKPKH